MSAVRLTSDQRKALKHKLTDDPDWRKLAISLNLEVEEFIEGCLLQMEHPGRQPELRLLSEAEVQAQGGYAAKEIPGLMQRIVQGEVGDPDQAARHLDGLQTKALPKIPGRP